LDNAHSTVATSLNSDVRNSLPQSFTVCSTRVKAYVPYSYQNISFKWKTLHATVAIHCEMLPKNPTLWLMRVHFMGCMDLLQIFDTKEAAIVIALQNRFYGLLIHSKMFYKSYYNQMTLDVQRNAITIGEHGVIDPSGLQQDCLEMTPLHILACSTVHNLELYQFMVEKYPGNLIVGDAWGATPLLYAVWGDTPSEIVQISLSTDINLSLPRSQIQLERRGDHIGTS
jgi:hypothetical protein